ncbi:hypothetical protein GCM10028801_11690 [Nocardioides maradonensis]
MRDRDQRLDALAGEVVQDPAGDPHPVGVVAEEGQRGEDRPGGPGRTRRGLARGAPQCREVALQRRRVPGLDVAADGLGLVDRGVQLTLDLPRLPSRPDPEEDDQCPDTSAGEAEGTSTGQRTTTLRVALDAVNTLEPPV